MQGGDLQGTTRGQNRPAIASHATMCMREMRLPPADSGLRGEVAATHAYIIIYIRVASHRRS